MNILLQTEGAYPFVKGGGVSTWSEIMCNQLVDRVNFTIYALLGNPYYDVQYDLPSNIKSILKIPLWGSELPIAYYEPERLFSSIASEKEFTHEAAVHEQFLPLFDQFMDCLTRPHSSNPEKVGILLYRFWQYFNRYSYKDTLRDQRVWEKFSGKIHDFYSADVLGRKVDSFNLLNATFGMRWLYHYLMPLDVGVPRVDVSHSTSSGFPAIASIIGKFEHGTPSVISDHGVFIRERIKGINASEDIGYFSKKMLINLSVIIAKAAYHYADVICPVTKSHSTWELRFGGSDDKIRPIINGVDINKFKPLNEADKISYERPTVVALANLFPLKGIETMIKTCRRVREDIPEVQFLLYGDTTVDEEYTQKCKKLVKELNLEHHFYIKGFHDNPTEVYNKGDISILTSISEGAPYTVLESMSCGCPVVATDVGGVREVLERCGIICRSGAVEELAEGVTKLLKDDLFRKVLGEESRRIVLSNFTAKKTVDAYYEEYRKLVHKPRVPLKTRLKDSYSFQKNGVNHNYA
ncbi:GT4 family glycosyltransferase PelF [Aliifodinibius sp. S!AR15-10]|nr:GT4 family glycosyltransferase PelF [Aliifodinibius sp. S!AR15-10]